MRFQRFRAHDGRYCWRFLSSNHRIVAISPSPFITPEDATAAIRDVRSLAGDARIDLTSDRGGMWEWALRLESGVCAVGAHPYGRRREADSAARRFQLAAPRSAVDEWIVERGEQRPRGLPLRRA